MVQFGFICHAERSWEIRSRIFQRSRSIPPLGTKALRRSFQIDPLPEGAATCGRLASLLRLRERAGIDRSNAGVACEIGVV